MRDALIGKNTIQAVKIIAAEFEGRFKGKGRTTAQDIIRVLNPGGKAVSWARVDVNICLLCKRFSMMAELLEKQRDFLGEGWEDMPEVLYRQIDFFDKVRLILNSLPRMGYYKLSEEVSDYSNAHGKIESFEPCFLCWRSVPRTRGEKKTPLCHVHDMMSTSKEYRRRKNMRKRMLEVLEKLEATVPTPADIWKESKLHPRDFYLRAIRVVNGYFPALAEYLYKITPQGIFLTIRCTPLSSPFRLIS